MILLFNRNLEVFLLNFDGFYKDLRKMLLKSIFITQFQEEKVAVGFSNRSFVC
jgi:hypothetical protein